MEVDKDTYDNARLSEFYYAGDILWDDSLAKTYNLIEQLEQKIPGISFYLENISNPPGPDFS